MGRVIRDPLRTERTQRIDALTDHLAILDARLQNIEARPAQFNPAADVIPGTWSISMPASPTYAWGAWFPMVTHPGLLLLTTIGISAGCAGNIEVRLYGPNGEAGDRPSLDVDESVAYYEQILGWKHDLPRWERGDGCHLEVWHHQTAGAAGGIATTCPMLWFTDHRGCVGGAGHWWTNEWPLAWT